MLAKALAQEALVELFNEKPVVLIDDLFTCLQTHSRMSCFRRLCDLGYLSSYSHAGKHYTLNSTPQFDAHGLWSFQGIGFSRSGNLKCTITELVESSSVGLTRERLEKLLQVSTRHALLDLVRQKTIRRERVDGTFAYISTDHGKAKGQLASFQKEGSVAQGRLPDWILVEVLAAVIRCGDYLPEPNQVLRETQARGHSISAEEIEQVFELCNLKKND